MGPRCPRRRAARDAQPLASDIALGWHSRAEGVARSVITWSPVTYLGALPLFIARGGPLRFPNRGAVAP